MTTAVLLVVLLLALAGATALWRLLGRTGSAGASAVAEAQTRASLVEELLTAVDGRFFAYEACADKSRRFIFMGPNRDKLLGGPTP